MSPSVEFLVQCTESREKTKLILAFLLLEEDTRKLWQNFSKQEVYGFAIGFSLNSDVFLEILSHLNNLSQSELADFVKFLLGDVKRNFTGSTARNELVLGITVLQKYTPISELSIKKRNVTFTLDTANVTIAANEGSTGLNTKITINNLCVQMRRGSLTHSLCTDAVIDLASNYGRSYQDWFNHIFASMADEWTSRLLIKKSFTTLDDYLTYLKIVQLPSKRLSFYRIWEMISPYLSEFSRGMTKAESDDLIAEFSLIKAFNVYKDDGGWIVGLEETEGLDMSHSIIIVEKQGENFIVTDETSNVYLRQRLAHRLSK